MSSVYDLEPEGVAALDHAKEQTAAQLERAREQAQEGGTSGQGGTQSR